MDLNYDLAKFDEFGYTIITGFMTDDERSVINRECNDLRTFSEQLTVNTGHWVMNEPNNPCKLDGAFVQSDILRSVATFPELKKSAQSILGAEDLDTYISKFFPMIPERGFSVDWHQDNYYIQGDRTKMVSCDVFVNGATRETGCLRVLSGSHNKTYPHDKRSHGVFRWMYIDDGNPDIVDIELDEPFAVIFDVNLVHGCYHNTSKSKYRYSIAWEYTHRGYLPHTYNNHQSQDKLKVE